MTPNRFTPATADLELAAEETRTIREVMRTPII